MTAIRPRSSQPEKGTYMITVTLPKWLAALVVVALALHAIDIVVAWTAAAQQ